MVYHDSHRYQSKNLSVHHGKLDVNLNGGAAFFFRPTPDTKGQTYGRFKIKFKVTGGFGYSARGPALADRQTRRDRASGLVPR